MSDNTLVRWGLSEMPLALGDAFDLARWSCSRAVEVARDVSIDHQRLQEFAAELDVDEIRDVTNGHMGENCDTLSAEFRDARDAVNFAVLFSLLQFGHGFRRELHEFCGVGASKTITSGTRRLRTTGELTAARLANATANEIRQWFGLPDAPALEDLTSQLLTVLTQTGNLLQQQGFEDFESLCRQVLKSREALDSPAAALVREFANLDCFYIGFGNNASIDEESFISALMLPVRETRVTWCLGSKALATAAPIVPVPPMMTIFMEDF